MYQVIWTELAKDTYAETLKILMNLSLDAAIELDDKVEALTDNLSRYRYLCPRSPKISRYRRCVISANTSLLYEVRGKLVFIIAILDNRAEQLFY
jgi:plasmid stabilization system protein ParE